MTRVEADEKAMARVLRAFIEACDEWDHGAVYARHALHVAEPTKADRATIKALRLAGHLQVYRGGQDEDGNVIGGTFYAATNAGRVWLAEIEKQQELPP